MALFHCNFNSKILNISTSMYVIIPEVEPNENETGEGNLKYQTLYLLHGGGDDHTKWVRRTPIERYARKYKIAVVMPEVGQSFYIDMHYGNDYWTFISEEVPKVARTFFHLSDKREDNFAAGLSMGGYGSFKLALSKPECFAAAASFSGALDINDLFSSKDDKIEKMAMTVFGGVDKINGSKNDLFYLAKKLKESGCDIPRLYQCCGTEDSLYNNNIKFRDFANEIKLDLTFEEGPGGHDWEYWDINIQKALSWFPLKCR